MKLISKSASQTGEIATIITIFSLAVILTGTTIGTRDNVKKNINKFFSSAQQQTTCDFDSISQVRVDGKVAKNISGFAWTSEGDGDTSFFGTDNYSRDNLESKWSPRPLPLVPYKNKHAKTTVTLPQEYAVISTFCENDTNNICRNVKVTNKNRTIGNIHMTCGGKVTYGWNVQPVANLSPTPSPKDLPRFQTYVGQCEASFEQVKDPHIEKITIGKPGSTPLFTLDSTNQNGIKKNGTLCSTNTIKPPSDPDVCIPFYLAFKNHSLNINFDPRRQSDVALTVRNPGFHQSIYDRQGLITGSGADPMEVTLYYFFKTGSGNDVTEEHHSTSVITKGGCEVRPTSTPTPTPSPTNTPIPTSTPVPTSLPSLTPIPTSTPYPTAINTSTPTPSPSPLPTTISCSLKSPNCQPQNLKAYTESDKDVRIEWDYPVDCPAFRQGIDPFWIDVVENGNTIVCAKKVFDNNTTCTLGKDVNPGDGRRVDNPNLKKWNESKSYSVNVVSNNSVSPRCVSDPASIAFPVVQVIECGETLNFVGELGSKTLQVNLGSDTGRTEFYFDPWLLPDKFKVIFDGQEVINTGFLSYGYDPDPLNPNGEYYWRNTLNAELRRLGLPELSGSGGNIISFNKNSSTTRATIIIESPFPDTKWDLISSCPNKPIDLPTYNSDADGNGNVNSLDFIQVIKNYGKNSINFDSNKDMHNVTDINKDGYTNSIDASLVIANFGKSVE